MNITTSPSRSAGPINAPDQRVLFQQAQYLGESIQKLQHATRYAHELRNTFNTRGDWQHVAASIVDAYRAASMLAEHSSDLQDLGGARYNDISVRSAIGDSHMLLERASDTQLTPLGRSRMFGQAAQQLVEARDVARQEFDRIWDLYTDQKNLDLREQMYNRLVGGTSQPLPSRANGRFS